jgi:hypothetical protein
MKRLIALAALVLGPQLAHAQANGPGAPGAPMPPIQQVPAMGQHLRDNWYIGFGVGYGDGRYNLNGQTVSFRDHVGQLSPVNFMLQFEVGATVRPDLLLGFDLRAVRCQGSGNVNGFDIDASVQANDYLAVVTWFPQQRGFFLRGGGGLSTLVSTASVSGQSGSDTVFGVGVLGGLGYAFWLGQHFNLTLNADVSAQAFPSSSDKPTSAAFFDTYLGFTWY